MLQHKILKTFISGTFFLPVVLGISSAALSQSQQDINMCSRLNQGLQQGDPYAQNFVQQNPNVVSYCRRLFNARNTINNTTTENARVMCRKTKNSRVS